MAQHFMGFEDVSLVDVVDDAQVGQFGEGLEVMVPVALGVEQASGDRLPTVPR